MGTCSVPEVGPQAGLQAEHDARMSAVGVELQVSMVNLRDVCVQEVNAEHLQGYKQSIMALSDGGKLYRSELEIVLCREPMV